MIHILRSELTRKTLPVIDEDLSVCVCIGSDDLELFVAVGLLTWHDVERQLQMDLPRLEVYVAGTRVRTRSALEFALPRCSIRIARYLTQNAFAPLQLLMQEKDKYIVTEVNQKKIEFDRSGSITVSCTLTRIPIEQLTKNGDIDLESGNTFMCQLHIPSPSWCPWSPKAIACCYFSSTKNKCYVSSSW